MVRDADCSALRVVGAIEAVIGLCLLAWVMLELQGNGWSLQDNEVYDMLDSVSAAYLSLVVWVGKVYAALGTGVGLVFASCGLLTKRWPFVLHAPLVAFWVLSMVF